MVDCFRRGSNEAPRAEFESRCARQFSCKKGLAFRPITRVEQQQTATIVFQNRTNVLSKHRKYRRQLRKAQAMPAPEHRMWRPERRLLRSRERKDSEPIRTQAREMVQQLTHPEYGPLRLLGIPIKLSDTPGSLDTAPPRFGEHNAQVLDSLGYSPEDVLAFAKAGVTATNG